MTDLVAFVLARLDEDEQAARAVAWGPNWKFRPQQILELPPAVTTDDGRGLLGGAESAAQHAARHDPARVLAQVAALRAVVAEYENARDWASGPDCPEESRDTYRRHAGSVRDVLHPLAGIWRDHEDFDPAWRHRNVEG